MALLSQEESGLNSIRATALLRPILPPTRVFLPVRPPRPRRPLPRKPPLRRSSRVPGTITATSVSYTHLDVYKRQTLARAPSFGPAPSEVPAAASFRRIGRLPGGRLFKAPQPALAAGPFARFGQQRGPKMSSGLWAHPRTPSVSWRHVSSVTCGDVLPYRAVDVKPGMGPAS